MLVWELVGAVIGAGFASGREIAVFFAQHNHWGYAGMAAAGSILLLAGEPMPVVWRGGFAGKLWNGLLLLLVISTGGGMLAGSGEIAANVLPFKGSRWYGMMITFVAGWLLANRTKEGLAWLSRGLICLLAMQLAAAFTVEPRKGAEVGDPSLMAAMISGTGYGGFNAALMSPLLADAAKGKGQNKRELLRAVFMILVILLSGMLLIRRNAALMNETMPFMVMMKQFGMFGYGAFVICLYLAILSTLTACLRAAKGQLLTTAGIAVVSCVGFGNVVGRLYPILGVGCSIMLVIAKIMNSCAGSFHSSKDMI